MSDNDSLSIVVKDLKPYEIPLKILAMYAGSMQFDVYIEPYKAQNHVPSLSLSLNTSMIEPGHWKTQLNLELVSTKEELDVFEFDGSWYSISYLDYDFGADENLKQVYFAQQIGGYLLATARSQLSSLCQNAGFNGVILPTLSSEQLKSIIKVEDDV